MGTSTPTPPRTARNRELAEDLRASIGDLVRATRAEDRTPPVTAAVLDLLDRSGPMTTAELAAHRRVRHQTMAATVAELVRAGLLVSRPDPADGRKKILSLAASGRRALRSDRDRRVAQLRGAIAQLPPADRIRLRDALDVIRRLVGLLDEDPGTGQFVTGNW